MFYEYLIRTQVYRHDVPVKRREQPLKWALGIIVLILALSVTFAEVGG